MRLPRLRRHWNELERRDPLWAVLTSPGKQDNKWEVDEFLQTGRAEITALMAYLDARGVDVPRQLHADVPGCRFVVNHTNRLDACASGTVDFVYSNLVLQHIHRRYVRRYLAEFMRVLVPGGVLVFQLPSGEEPPVRGHGLKTLLPLPIVGAIRRIRRLATFPRMEVRGVPRAEVERLLSRLGGTVIDVIDDRSHGEDTPGYRYCVRKR
jgi:SAM-dependent methyltransferase